MFGAGEVRDVDIRAPDDRLGCYRAYAKDLPSDGGRATLTRQVVEGRTRVASSRKPIGLRPTLLPTGGSRSSSGCGEGRGCSLYGAGVKGASFQRRRCTATWREGTLRMSLAQCDPVPSWTPAADCNGDASPRSRNTATRRGSSTLATRYHEESGGGGHGDDPATPGVAQWRRYRRRSLIPAGAVLMGAVITAVVLGFHGKTSSSPSMTTVGACHSRVVDGVLPAWMRYGFSDPAPRAAYVVSERGRIAGILFGGQLYSPPRSDPLNKILWVSRTGSAGPLVIDGVRAGSGQHVHREVAEGPGPSHVDLPAAGCWQLRLRWGSAPNQRDTLDLVYTRR
jgi:hypothetical protein